MVVDLCGPLNILGLRSGHPTSPQACYSCGFSQQLGKLANSWCPCVTSSEGAKAHVSFELGHTMAGREDVGAP